MNDLSQSLKILAGRYPGTMTELARRAQIDRSSLYKILDGKRTPSCNSSSTHLALTSASPRT